MVTYDAEQRMLRPGSRLDVSGQLTVRPIESVTEIGPPIVVFPVFVTSKKK